MYDVSPSEFPSPGAGEALKLIGSEKQVRIALTALSSGGVDFGFLADS